MEKNPEQNPVKHLLSGGAAVLPDIKPCVQPLGRTGGENPVMEWKCWLNIWATCQMSTEWDGEDRDLQEQSVKACRPHSYHECVLSCLLLQHQNIHPASEDAVRHGGCF